MLLRIFRDCAVIIRRVAEKLDGGGALSDNNVKIGGLKSKLLLLQGDPNFHFMSCHFALNFKKN